MKNAFGGVIVFLMVCTASLAAEESVGFNDLFFRDHGLVMLIIDPVTGNIVAANKSAASYYGHAVEQLKQMRIQQINTLNRAEVEMEMERAKTEKRNFFIFRHRLADGSIRPVEVYSSPITINNKPLLYSVIIDVSQRETLLETVTENESRMRYAEQVANFGHWLLDLTTGQYQFSEGATRVLGLDRNSYPAEEIFQMIVPEDRDQLANSHRRLVETNQPYSAAFRFQRPDGTVIDVNSEGNYDQASQQIFGVIEDITREQTSLRALKSRNTLFYFVLGLAVTLQFSVILLLIKNNQRRKSAELKLRKEEHDLKESQRLAHVGNWRLNLATNQVVWSEELYRMFGFDSSFPPPTYNEQIRLFTPESWEELSKAITRTSTTGTPYQLELKTVKADGSNGWIWAQGEVEVDLTGKTVGLWGVTQDISERKRASDLLQQKNEELEQFIYLVSHDLKSPLITISSFLEVLQQDVANNNTERIAKDIHFIRGGIDKMDQLLTALLQLSRIGRKEVETQRISLQSLIDSSLAAVAGSVREHGIDVVIEPHNLQLVGDSLQLGQIWQNLIENAIKYRGHAPKPRIVVGVDLSTGQPEFFVCDNGIGIAPKHADRIFGLFAQLHPESDGCGLGLALVKKIVKRYQGSIRVVSDGLGKGSCFRFTLPGALEQGESIEGTAP